MSESEIFSKALIFLSYLFHTYKIMFNMLVHVYVVLRVLFIFCCCYCCIVAAICAASNIYES